MVFSNKILDLDPEPEIAGIAGFIREMTLSRFKRKGAVVGLSGGIDSAVTAALCVRALGAERVLALFLPEKESNPVSLEYGRAEAARLGIESIEADITPHLESFGVYARRNAVIREIYPEFGGGWRFHLTLPQDLLERDRLNYYSITVEDPDGRRQSRRISPAQWQAISACQNIKQRTRMIVLYDHAERSKYLVAGTTNRSEAAQGFFVKHGDGGVDIEPLAHLYKTQVYRLANALQVTPEIIARAPSPDTYSLPVTDKEFYFCLDYSLLDLILYGYEHAVPVEEMEKTLDLRREEIERVFKDLRAKEQATWHLRTTPPTFGS
jgi:NAD+ synthase